MVLGDERVTGNLAFGLLNTQCIGMRPAQVKAELQALAGVLELREMEQALEGAFKRELRQTLVRDLGGVEAVCESSAEVASKEVGQRDALRPDVVLLLADREVAAHSVVLRARSPFWFLFGMPIRSTCASRLDS